jgi:DNA-binding winged helix-turn-helix (wHTH) protein
MAVGENNLQVQISLLRKTLQEDTSGESYLVV